MKNICFFLNRFYCLSGYYWNWISKIWNLKKVFKTFIKFYTKTIAINSICMYSLNIFNKLFVLPFQSKRLCHGTWITFGTIESSQILSNQCYVIMTGQLNQSEVTVSTLSKNRIQQNKKLNVKSPIQQRKITQEFLVSK